MNSISIDEVSLYPVTTPRVSGKYSQHIIVRLDADDGTVGWGEMSDISHLPAIMPDVDDLSTCLSELLVGRSVMATNKIEDALLTNFPGTRFYGKACLVRAGVSIAIHDLKARILGVSLSELLGGKRRERMPVCFPIFRMQDREDVADRLELVENKWEEGFRNFRFYFGHNTDADEELLQEICGRYGDALTLTSLDGSGHFTVPAFQRIYRRLQKFPFETIESPVKRDDIDAIAEVRRTIDHPVSEHVRSPAYALRLIKSRAVDIFNVSITVAGGIQGMLKLFSLAEAANIECLIGTTQELSIATAAQAHVGAVAPSLDYASDPVGPRLYTKDVTDSPVEFDNGDLLVPEGEGLGVRGDEDKLVAVNGSPTALKDVVTGFLRD